MLSQRLQVATDVAQDCRIVPLSVGNGALSKGSPLYISKSPSTYAPVPSEGGIACDPMPSVKPSEMIPSDSISESIFEGFARKVVAGSSRIGDETCNIDSCPSSLKMDQNKKVKTVVQSLGKIPDCSESNNRLSLQCKQSTDDYEGSTVNRRSGEPAMQEQSSATNGRLGHDKSYDEPIEDEDSVVSHFRLDLESCWRDLPEHQKIWSDRDKGHAELVSHKDIHIKALKSELVKLKQQYIETLAKLSFPGEEIIPLSTKLARIATLVDIQGGSQLQTRSMVAAAALDFENAQGEQARDHVSKGLPHSVGDNVVKESMYDPVQQAVDEQIEQELHSYMNRESGR